MNQRLHERALLKGAKNLSNTAVRAADAAGALGYIISPYAKAYHLSFVQNSAVSIRRCKIAGFLIE
jgi:hypothetical protein